MEFTRIFKSLRELEIDLEKLIIFERKREMKRKNSDEFDDERFLKRTGSDKDLLYLSEIEKQIVEKSLSMIGKASTSDWNYEREDDRMILHTYTMIGTFLHEMIVEVSYVEEETNCRVLYRVDNGVYREISYKWDNDILNNEIRFTKLEEEKFLYIFSRSVKKNLHLESTNYDTWFYFQDARSHLQDLSSR